MINNLFIRRSMSYIPKSPINITENAWTKMDEIINDKEMMFLFSATSGGCSGFNYDLQLINNDKYNDLTNSKIPPTIMKQDNIQVLIEPTSEFLLLGTTIDHISQDYENNIFENKFIFRPDKKLASGCGCGVSFTPKD